MFLPLGGEESFHARVQKYNRVQIPVLVRWKHKLKIGEVLRVEIEELEEGGEEDFYAKVLDGGRITIPKLVVELLDIQPKAVVHVTLYPMKLPSEEEG